MMRRAVLVAGRSGVRWNSSGVWDTTRECFLENVSEGKGAVLLKMNRPSRKNAFGRVMLQQFGECLGECTADSKIRSVVLLSTVNGVFSAGADLKERKEMSQDEASAFVTSLRSTFTNLEGLRCPTISVINGVALGGGLELALSTDLRVCTPTSRLGVPETGLAIIPGAGGTQRLPRAIGIPRAKEMIFTADPVLGKRAEDIGLVNYCEEDEEAALARAIALATRIARNGPLALENAKRAVDDGSELPRKEGMEVEKACYAKILTTKDRVRGLEAFAKREVPVYEGN
eukprot:TRINITY_DN14891_c0_g2_i2.p1 TRINITY_DN14891_c0_g2~~TRINITY_DN14891_c0_g2_i2.p1  ORF type:complete len:298 (+),score=132.88 TRINITY_DN14891_c0_g2_i2:35-895(+)